MNILIFSGDSFLIDLLRRNFEGNASINVADKGKPMDKENYDIIIFDCVGANFIGEILAGLCLSGRLVINIGQDFIDGLTNMRLPFRVSRVLQKISDFIARGRANMIFCRSGVIILDDNIFLKYNIVVRFTEKEMELIRTVARENGIGKRELIESVWGPKTQNDKVLETTLLNIRRKLAEAGAEDFIGFSDDHFSIMV
jgi:hypothetical protein